jgi:hypothetical protein
MPINITTPEQDLRIINLMKDVSNLIIQTVPDSEDYSEADSQVAQKKAEICNRLHELEREISGI